MKERKQTLRHFKAYLYRLLLSRKLSTYSEIGEALVIYVLGQEARRGGMGSDEDTFLLTWLNENGYADTIKDYER